MLRPALTWEPAADLGAVRSWGQGYRELRLDQDLQARRSGQPRHRVESRRVPVPDPVLEQQEQAEPEGDSPDRVESIV
ncbi:MAG: hypothetical protein C4293_20780 [Nitrospiraceae bacterium]